MIDPLLVALMGMLRGRMIFYKEGGRAMNLFAAIAPVTVLLRC